MEIRGPTTHKEDRGSLVENEFPRSSRDSSSAATAQEILHHQDSKQASLISQLLVHFVVILHVVESL